MSRDTALRLDYLPVNQAWCFTFGDQLVPIGGRVLFGSREDAVSAMALAPSSKDMTVDDTGLVIVRNTTHDGCTPYIPPT